MLEKYKKVIKYVIAGGVATFVNLGALFVCVEYFRLWYLISAVISFVCGLVTSYILQKFWTFKDGKTKNMHIQFAGFTIFALGILALNTALMYLFVDVLKIWYLLAQAFAALLIAFINFNFFNRIIFKQKAPESVAN